MKKSKAANNNSSNSTKTTKKSNDKNKNTIVTVDPRRHGGVKSSSSSSSQFSHQTIPLVDNSAMCIVPPKCMWHQIDTIRSIHDKSYGRWPPHMNLFFPFIPSSQFESLVISDLTHRLRTTVKPFTVQLNEITCNEDSKYLFLVPEVVLSSGSVQNPFYEIIRQVMLVLPQCKSAMTGKVPSNLESWTPHLTLGQFPKEDINAIRSQLQSQWETIEFEISEITLMSRTGRDDPFKMMTTIKLGT